jgi:hypothetical protein
MASRGLARVRQKVVHRHRIGARVFRRVSELVFIRDAPKAILRWIDSAGVRTPIYVDLDPSLLERTNTPRIAYRYEGTTVDPADVELDRAPSPN